MGGGSHPTGDTAPPADTVVGEAPSSGSKVPFVRSRREVRLTPTGRGTFGPTCGPVPGTGWNERPTWAASNAYKEQVMKRKLFDVLASLISLGMVVVLVVTGGLPTWAHSFANSNI